MFLGNNGELQTHLSLNQWLTLDGLQLFMDDRKAVLDSDTLKNVKGS